MKILTIFGTRPEALKMAPVVRALAAERSIASVVCVTGQHREMLRQVLEPFEIEPDYNLEAMVHDQTLNGLASRIIGALDPILESLRPDRVLVHGDTTTAMAASIAAFHRRVPIGHVEAGLRTYDFGRPWPEEKNRRLIDQVADLLLAPTPWSRANLESERLDGRIVVTGNTVIDALHITVRRLETDAGLRSRLGALYPFPSPGRLLLLITGHRRENFGEGFKNICAAIAQLAKRPDIQIVYPVHLNPNVQGPVKGLLGGLANVHLIEPLDYLPFVHLMRQAHIVLTDSGGVQEEAPSLGKPVLVMRDVTERPEAVAAGTVQLVGTDTECIVAAVNSLMDNEQEYRRFSRRINPYGDGRASERILGALTGRPVDEFTYDPSDKDTVP